MANDLIPADALLGLPGAPFTEVEVDGAVEALRGALGWHVAPTRADTVVMDVNWPARWITLPTRHLVSVESVADADTGEEVPADRYRVSTYLHSLRQRGRWPLGYEAVEVAMTHGFTECPADLLPVVAGMIVGQRGGAVVGPVTQVTNASYSMSFEAGGVSSVASAAATISRYSLRDEVVIA